MKNQNDLIVIGVCVFLSIVAALCTFFMKREPVAPAQPTAVITTPPVYPTNTQPTMATSLSGGGTSTGMGGFGGGFGGMRGAPGGFGGGGKGNKPKFMMGSMGGGK